MSAETDIRARRVESNAAIASRDVAAVVAILTPDVTVAVAGGPVLRGREASRQAFAEQMADPAFRGYVRTPASVEVGADGVTAIERGEWVGSWQGRLRVEQQRGRYTADWRNLAGVWSIASEIFVGEM